MVFTNVTKLSIICNAIKNVNQDSSMTERGVVAGFSIKPVSEMVAHSESTSQNKCMYEKD